MIQTALAWLRQRRRLLLRELIIFICALGLGMGYSFWRSDTYLPSIDGNIYSMLALDDSLLMVLANGNSNSLVRIDHTGMILNYMSTKSGQAFQYLESDGETVYAILSYEKHETTHQRLVSLSLKNSAMRTKVLLELTELYGAPTGITWREIYLVPSAANAPSIKLSGIDEQGQGYLAHWDMETSRVRFEKILPNERVFALKYVEDGHYVWISQEKETGQYINGVWQRNMLSGLSDTPLHISTCGTRCFLSDSISGDIFEILPDGTAILQRNGGDSIGGSGFQYRELEIYTTYQSPTDAVRIVGLCAAGNRSVIAGEDWSIRELHPGTLRLLMLWQHGWLAALISWIILAALVESIYLILRSPRLSVRLLLCEAIVAVILLTSVTVVQYYSFQETIQEEAYQKLRLIGGSLAASLSFETQRENETVDTFVDRLEHQVSVAMAGHEKEYEICVLWNTEYGPVVASDNTFPAGYLLEDVASREYLSVVSRVLSQGSAVLEQIQTDTSRDYLYVQPFVQGERAACVAVSQNEAVMLAGQTKFFRRLLPILSICPILFLALVWISRRLLNPLNEIQRALEEFYTDGSGGQMQLDNMPRTELYEMGRVFNQLSVQTKVQFNELRSINDAYARLVPDCLLKMLRRRSVTQLSAGDHTPVAGGLLVLIPRNFHTDWESLSRLTKLAAEPIAQADGMLVDYDEGLSSLTALFPQVDDAHACAMVCLERLEQNRIPAMAAVLDETVELGVFGGEHLLYPLAVSREMRRKQAVLERVLDFGALLAQTGCVGRTDLRLLGWDGDLEIYEDPTCHLSSWQSQWRDAASLWADALRLFREMNFPAAMRLFAKVLRLMPEDMAAHWYLFRCEVLRDSGTRTADTGLLFDWEEPSHE